MWTEFCMCWSMITHNKLANIKPVCEFWQGMLERGKVNEYTAHSSTSKAKRTSSIHYKHTCAWGWLLRISHTRALNVNRHKGNIYINGTLYMVAIVVVVFWRCYCCCQAIRELFLSYVRVAGSLCRILFYTDCDWLWLTDKYTCAHKS